MKIGVGCTHEKCVKFFTHLKVANYIIHRQCFGTTQSGEVENLLVVERLVVLLGEGHVYGRVQGRPDGVEDARRRSARHVCAQRHGDAGLQQAAHVAQAAAQAGVGGGAVRHGRAALRQQAKLLLEQVHAVRQDGLVGEQARAVIHFGVVGALWVRCSHRLDLSHVLGDVGLDVEVPGARQVGQLLHEVHVAAEGEARRHHGLHQRALQLLHPVHEAVRVVERALRRLVVRRVAVDVHVDLADEGALAGSHRAPRQLQRALRVDGGEVAGQRRPCAQAAAHHGVVHLGRELGVRVAALQRERVRPQPVQEGLVVAEARVGELRRVQVRVHEAGQQQLSGPQHHRRGHDPQRRAQRGGVAAAQRLGQHHLAILDDDDAVVHHGDALEPLRMDEGADEHGGGLHLDCLVHVEPGSCTGSCGPADGIGSGRVGSRPAPAGAVWARLWV